MQTKSDKDLLFDADTPDFLWSGPRHTKQRNMYEIYGQCTKHRRNELSRSINWLELGCTRPSSL